MTDPKARRKFPEPLKRQIVAQTFEPGNSVSLVARRHDLNANQLFAWRRQFQPVAADPQRMLPVEIVVAPQLVPDASAETASSMEIAVAEKRITTRGTVSVVLLRAAIKALSA